MKKFFSIMFVGTIIISMLVLSASCGKDIDYNLATSWDVPDYVNSGTVVEGESALDIFNEALDNYYDADYVIFQRSMEFDAGLVATQQTIDTTKFYNDEVFFQGTKQGTSAGKSNEGTRFYSDGTDAWEVKVDDKDRFPELGTEDWEGMEYEEWASQDKTVAEKLESMRNFSLYDIRQETLADNHDDNVYEMDGKYYICLTIDCMDIELDTVQKDVEEDIMRALGDTAQPGTFEWVDDTKLYMEITNVDGDYYITARSLKEDYKAVQAILPVTCDQVISGTFSYAEEDCEITDDEKMNLA